MKTLSLKMIVKFFLAHAIPFGIGMGILNGIQNGLKVGIISGFSTGFFFGLWVTLFLLYDSYKAKKSGRNPSLDFIPFQKSTVELDLNLDNAFEKCVKALEQSGAKIKLQDKQKSEIKATSNMSWKGWGEILTFQLTDLKNGKVKIEISSSPKLKTQIVDLTCKGKENVEQLTNILTTENR